MEQSAGDQSLSTPVKPATRSAVRSLLRSPPSAGDQSLSTPMKPATRSAVRSLLRTPPPTDQIATPEKPIELPRFSRGKGVVYSLKQVKRAALGAQASEQIPEMKEGTSGAGGDDDLSHAEEQIFSSSGDLARKKVKAKASPNLPQKYENLFQFFKCLLTSFRLLRLKGQVCTFSNICPKIESLTDRRFSYVHLAQLKYIVPEAIVVKKILSRDEATCCMKPDLQINLHIDALGVAVKEKQESSYAILTKVFRTRLVEFFNEHPEGDEIPQDPLPESFGQLKRSALSKETEYLNPISISVPLVGSSDAASTLAPLVKSSDAASRQQFAASSHISMSFQRRFSRRPIVEQKSHLSSSSSPILQEVPFVSSKDTSLNEEKSCEKATNKATNIDDRPGGTPAKLMATPARKMTATPELRTPKRSHSAINDDTTSFKKPVRRPLSLTPVKNGGSKNENAEDEKAESDDNDAMLRFLPKSLLQSVREKERKVTEDQEAGVSESKRRQQMIACLPKLFDMILLLFQSIRRSALTKQELVSKIIASHCDIVDRSEVEEQLSLLQEILPDWISGKMVFTGDFIICIDKIASPELMRKRLAEAK